MAGELAVAAAIGMAVSEEGTAATVMSDARGGELVHLLGGNARLNEGSHFVKDGSGNGTGLTHGFEIPAVRLENHCGKSGDHGWVSSKLQEPSSREIPKSKSQIPKKSQNPNFKQPSLGF